MGKGWNLHVQAIVRNEELIERMKDTAEMFWEKIKKEENWKKLRY